MLPGNTFLFLIRRGGVPSGAAAFILYRFREPPMDILIFKVHVRISISGICQFFVQWNLSQRLHNDPKIKE